MNRKLKLLALPAASLATALVGVLAWAYWTTGGTGYATASVGDLGAPADVAGQQRGFDPVIDVTWAGVTAPGDGAVDGYHVERRPSSASSWVDACGTLPSALDTNGPGCADTGLEAGTYYYRVTAVFRSWTATSAETASSVTVVLDTTAPTVSNPAVSAAVSFGTNPMFVTNETLSLTTSALDAQTGVQSVTYYYCAGSAGICNTVEIGFSTIAAGNYPVTWGIPLPADGPYRITAVARDNAGNSATSTPTLIAVDSTPPVVSTPTVNG